MNMKTGVLLVNLGTPDSPATGDVRKYLREFLMDYRVLDINPIGRFFLVNGIIAPFRAPKSAKVYKQLWEDRGSPLKFYGEDVRDLVQQALGDDYVVRLGMRYQSPSIPSAMADFKAQGIPKIVVVPLFPQYASASTGSATEEVMKEISSWNIIPQVSIISKFFDHPLFIQAFAEIGKKYLEQHHYDHIVFSYHGLPERQILRGSVQNYCQLGNCCGKYHQKNSHCYRAQCFETSRLLASAMGISEENYTNCFQSRLGKTPWIKPYADDIIPELAKKGKKKVLFFSPSFVADCLETTIEGGVEYKELFEENGGEHWQLVESLNKHPRWIECLIDLVKKNS
ncbi:MAG: ferrochelatase [Cytophagaceae bacterium]|nr:ferrochelatase [Cytophagaceae bacterium]